MNILVKSTSFFLERQYRYDVWTCATLWATLYSIVYQHDVTGICCWAISLTSALGNTTFTHFRFCCCFMKISRRTSFTEDKTTDSTEKAVRRSTGCGETWDRTFGRFLWSRRRDQWATTWAVLWMTTYFTVKCCCRKFMGWGQGKGLIYGSGVWRGVKNFNKKLLY